MSIKYLRIIGGENIVADLVEDNSDNVVITNPIVAIPTSESQIAFAPWAAIQDPSESNITIDKRHIIFITECAPQIADQYANMFGTIIAPSKQLIL